NSSRPGPAISGKRSGSLIIPSRNGRSILVGDRRRIELMLEAHFDGGVAARAIFLRGTGDGHEQQVGIAAGVGNDFAEADDVKAPHVALYSRDRLEIPALLV